MFAFPYLSSAFICLIIRAFKICGELVDVYTALTTTFTTGMTESLTGRKW